MSEDNSIVVASPAPENVDSSQSQNVVQGQPAPLPANQQQQHSMWSIVKGILLRAVIIYFITSFFRRPDSSKTTPSPSSNPVSNRITTNLFPKGTALDLFVFLSEDEKLPEKKGDSLIWFEPNIIYGDWTGGPNGDGTYTHEATISATESMQRNGSIWLHTCIVKHGRITDPAKFAKDKLKNRHGTCKKRLMNKYKKLHYKRTHNLLTGETSATPEEIKKAEETPMEIVSHWHPNLTINIIDDHTSYPNGQIPPPIDEFYQIDRTSFDYYPVIYLNDYWNLMKEYTPINDTVNTLSINLVFQPLTMFRWQLYAAQAMRSRWTSFLGQDIMQESDEDQDHLKEALLETSPYLLALTVVVSVAHSIFEFLAFKNDIQFWNNRKSLEGLSVRSVFFNVFQSVIVLLYVLDNDTNFVVRISVAVGLLIEIWKIKKVSNVKIDREDKIFGFIPKITITDKGSYVESSTKQYDMLAFRYLSWGLFPLLGCYAVYSLIYLEHKGWYSWVLSMLYGFLLTFGFIMMTPQLFINYKLKSVAHLPWRMLSYKFLNTFIDDIFAFIIKMPTMYRLGCFRDDIVFCIFLYQRWIYRVDPKRMNEFGTSGEIDTQQSDGNAIQANGDIPQVDGSSAAIQAEANGSITVSEQPKSSEEKKNE